MRAISVGLTLVFLAACNREPAMDASMKADLEAASAGNIELAPRAQGTQVVSPIEAKNVSQPRVAPVRRVSAPAPSPKPETREPTQTAESEPTAVRPTNTPAVRPPPPGGYKTVNEVIRNAPFPIKP